MGFLQIRGPHLSGDPFSKDSPIFWVIYGAALMLDSLYNQVKLSSKLRRPKLG